MPETFAVPATGLAGPAAGNLSGAGAFSAARKISTAGGGFPPGETRKPGARPTWNHDVLLHNSARACGFLRHSDPKAQRSRNLIELKRAHRCPAHGVGYGKFGSQAIREHAARAIPWQLKADSRICYRPPDVVGHLYRQWFRYTGTGHMFSALSGHYGDAQTGGLGRE